MRSSKPINEQHKLTWSQRWQIPILIYAIAAILIIFAGKLYYKENLKISYEKTEVQLNTLNKLKSQEILNWFSERRKDLTFYGNNTFFLKEVESFLKQPANRKNILKEWLHHSQQSHNYDIFIVDGDGNSFFISGNDSTPLAQKVIDSCTLSMNIERDIFIDMYRRPNTQKILHISIQQLKLPSDHPNVCLVFRTDIYAHLIDEVIFENNRFQDVLYTLIKNEGDSVFLINEKTLISTDDLSTIIPDESKDSPFNKAIAGKEGTFKGKGYEGKEIIASIKRIPGSSWYLAVHMDVENMENPLSKNWITIIGYPLLLIVIFILWHLRFVQKIKNKNLEIQLQLNDELINNREILQTIIQSSPLPLIVISKKKKVLIWNSAATKVFGWDFNEIMNIENPLFNSANNHEWEEIQENLEKGKDLYVFETLKYSKEGKIMDLMCWSSNVLDPIKKENNYLFIFDDITERKRIADELVVLNESLEQRVAERTKEVADLNETLTERASQLEMLNSELESFTYSVSHDLKAPLRSIQGFSDIILQEYSNDLNEELTRLFQIIRRNAKKMDQLIRDLLDLTRITRTNLRLIRIDMNQLVDEVLKSEFASSLNEKVRIEKTNLLPSAGDIVLLRQVWVNLISNALKYSQKNEEIVIKIDSIDKNDCIQYSITDNGVGFNPEFKSKLFNVFQRLHSDKEFEGTGVGLAIIRRIINRHGGEVWADSEEGQGATFTFTLPTEQID